ncbi:MAG: NAD+ synthase [Candidatus Omnitrophota bacterium]|nr:NAD+ synthase [Candidatus Omnitrophota bacterium]
MKKRRCWVKKTLRISIAQINCTVGDLDGNAKKIIEYLRKAKALGADIVSFPELAVTGYPPEDLLLKEAFVADNLEALKRVARTVNEITAIVGFVDKAGRDLYNAAAVIYKGEIKGICHKELLPNYGVFDEKRYFKPGKDSKIFSLGNFIFGVNICEDIWHTEGPICAQSALGAKLIININSSPYHAGKVKEREQIVRNQAKANNVIISYTNLVGGQDELVFDGQSMVVDNAGKVMARAEAFREDIIAVDVDINADGPILSTKAIVVAEKYAPAVKGPIVKKDVRPMEPAAEIYNALTLGLKDYTDKNSFKKCVIGLSGGIDSALVAALARDAIGKDNVLGVFMPTRYSSRQSEVDAKEVAFNLGIKFNIISIEHIYKLYLMSLEPQFAAAPKDITEENVQARIRGNVLMALSNKFGYLVVTTGNKSEMSTGYATLYGDMAGGFAVIKDVPKTLVYRLAEYRNSVGKAIPESVIRRAPTAELKPDQKDQDTLPPYDILDRILKEYVEEDKGYAEIAAMGFNKDVVAGIINMVDRSEYKRRQSPPGIKITPKAFGRDRRMPITNKYK